MHEITVATVQMKPQLGRVEDNLVKMGEFITRVASEQHVDLIVFPELITTGYEVGPRFPNLAQLVPGAAVNVIAQRASEMGVHVVFGMATKEEVETIIYNTAVLIGPDGELIGQYNKLHLKGEEQLTFRPGYRLRNVFETALGNVGLMIGWDLAFPEVARCAALDGAEVLALCANWEEPHSDAWRTLLKARALENAIFIAAANRVGEEPSYTFIGESTIVGPSGEVYAHIQPRSSQPVEPAAGGPADEEPLEGYAVARLDLDLIRQFREETQMMQCRQPAAYRAIVKKY